MKNNKPDTWKVGDKMYSYYPHSFNKLVEVVTILEVTTYEDEGVKLYLIDTDNGEYTYSICNSYAVQDDGDNCRLYMSDDIEDIKELINQDIAIYRERLAKCEETIKGLNDVSKTTD